MRNTLQHPITKDEMIKVLEDIKTDWLKEQSEKMIIGGIRGAVLNEIIKLVKASDSPTGDDGRPKVIGRGRKAPAV